MLILRQLHNLLIKAIQLLICLYTYIHVRNFLCLCPQNTTLNQFTTTFFNLFFSFFFCNFFPFHDDLLLHPRINSLTHCIIPLLFIYFPRCQWSCREQHDVCIWGAQQQHQAQSANQLNCNKINSKNQQMFFFGFWSSSLIFNSFEIVAIFYFPFDYSTLCYCLRCVQLAHSIS